MKGTGMLQALRYFQAVVETKSFTKAAKLCHISQSAISQQIQNLEKELQVTLLYRKNRKIELSPAGKHFYLKSKKLVEEYDRLCEETLMAADTSQKELRAGILKGIDHKAVFQALKEFTRRNPEIRLSLVEGSQGELAQALSADEVDLILCLQPGISSEYASRFLFEQPFWLEVSKEYPAGTQGSVEHEELGKLPVHLLSSNEKGMAFYTELLDLKDPHWACSLEEARKRVLLQPGAVLVELVDSTPLEFLDLVVLCNQGIPLKKRYLLFWKEGGQDFLIEELARTLEESFSTL